MSTLVFILAAISMATLQGAFFRTVARHDAAAFTSDDEVMQQLARPSRFLSIMVDATASRLHVLFRRSPYPDAERLRLLTLASVAVVIAVLVLQPFSN